MENKFDARIKQARTNEQEYAHQFTPKTREEEYQYPDEANRITYKPHDISDDKTSEELYGVEPEQTIVPSNPSGKIKVRVNVKDIVEDHRQRSYKVKIEPPIYSKSDFTSENQNDPREDEINKLRETSKSFAEQIEKEQNTDITNPTERFAEENPNVGVTFNVGDKVKHTEEDIDGEVKFVNDKRVAVVWADKTRERFALNEAKEFLKVTKAYTDIQEQIDPVHTPDYPKNEKLEDNIDKALSSMETETETEEDTKIAALDIEKVKMKRKIAELEDKANEVDIEKIKTKAANEVISLMQKKGLLSNDESDVQEQFDSIMAMDDVGFESFKKAIVSTKKAASDEDEIYALLGEDDDFSDIEDGAEMARARETIKQETKASRSVDGIEMGDTSFFENGGLSNFRGNIGDFSGANLGSSSSSEQGSRSLSKSAGNRKPIERQSSSLDMSGFQDIQGLKTPINIPNKDLSVRGKFADLFDGMGWTGIPKR